MCRSLRVRSHENVSKDHDYCHTIMLEEDNIILKYNQDKKYLGPYGTQNQFFKNFMHVMKFGRIFHSKKKRTYSVWLFIIYTLFVR